jgi:carbon-monoxide dehydrogenase medium subunit
MRPAPFDYHRAGSVDEAAAMLAQLGPDARILSGGQSLIPAMTLRLARPSAVVDIGSLRALAGWSVEDATLRIGARTTHADIERSAELRTIFPLLPEVARHIAHPSVRSRGSFGGSLAHADPAAEWPAIFLACGGTARVVSIRGERRISADAFFHGMFATALEPDEVLTYVELPLPRPNQRYAFGEHARQHGAFATALSVVRIETTAQGTLSRIRVVAGACGPRPVVAVDRSFGGRGEAPSRDFVAAVAGECATALDSQDDAQATGTMRRQILRSLVQRSLSGLCGLAA